MILAIAVLAVVVAISFAFLGAYYAMKNDENDHRLD
jgi:hypothetical protein